MIVLAIEAQDACSLLQNQPLGSFIVARCPRNKDLSIIYNSPEGIAQRSILQDEHVGSWSLVGSEWSFGSLASLIQEYKSITSDAVIDDLACVLKDLSFKALTQKDIHQWDNGEVALWLIQNDYLDVCPAFLRHGITGTDLLNLTDDDLRDLGISNLFEYHSVLNQVRSVQFSHHQYHHQVEHDNVWLRPELGKHSTYQLLQGCDEGCFIVRSSERRSGLVLTYVIYGRPYNEYIDATNTGYFLERYPDQIFKSLHQLVRFYSNPGTKFPVILKPISGMKERNLSIHNSILRRLHRKEDGYWHEVSSSSNDTRHSQPSMQTHQSKPRSFSSTPVYEHQNQFQKQHLKPSWSESFENLSQLSFQSEKLTSRRLKKTAKQAEIALATKRSDQVTKQQQQQPAWTEPDWLNVEMSHDEARDYLMGLDLGTFLVHSGAKMNTLELSFVSDQGITSYTIKQSQDGYTLQDLGQYFDSLNDLIEFYSQGLGLQSK